MEPGSLDDYIRSVLDRIRVTLSGQLEADLAASTADIQRTVADERRRAISDAEERVAGKARLEALHRGATAEIEGLERTLGGVRDELAVARRDLGAMQMAQDELARELERMKRRAGDGQEQLERLRLKLDETSRLTSAFRALDEATSLGDVLDRLTHAACQESGRTAVFLVTGSTLRGWRAFGFASSDSIVGADFDSGASDVVAQAARCGTVQHRRNGEGLPSFAGDAPRDAVALPVQVGGSVIAVLYADITNADTPEEAQWVETMNALAKHAGRMLEAVTVNQAAALWTPRTGARRSPHDGSEKISVGRE